MSFLSKAFKSVGNLASKGLGFVSNNLGSIFNQGLDLGKSLLGQSYGASLGSRYAISQARKTADLEYKYAKLYALNNPSWQVQGLRSAGLNPILAATDGAFRSPTLASFDSSNPSVGDVFSGSKSFYDVMQQRNAMSLQKQQILNAEAQNKLLEAQAESVRAQTDQTRQDTFIKKQEYDVSKERFFNYGLHKLKQMSNASHIPDEKLTSLEKASLGKWYAPYVIRSKDDLRRDDDFEKKWNESKNKPFWKW